MLWPLHSCFFCNHQCYQLSTSLLSQLATLIFLAEIPHNTHILMEKQQFTCVKENSMKVLLVRRKKTVPLSFFGGSFVCRWVHLCGYIAWLLSCLSDDDALEADVPVKMTAKWIARKTTQGVHNEQLVLWKHKKATCPNATFSNPHSRKEIVT